MLIITGENELRRLIHRIEHWESQENVLDACDDPMMVVGRVVKARAQMNVLASPSKRQNARRGIPSLRRGISNALDIRKEHSRDSAMVNVFVDPSRMPVGKYGLGSLYEGASEWHHPVYGHAPIVFQSPHPYMGSAVLGVSAGLEIAGTRSLYTIAKHIDSM